MCAQTGPAALRWFFFFACIISMPVMMAVDCLPGSPQAWDSNCVLSSTGAPHFLPKRLYLKPTKPAQRRLAFTPEPFQPPISNRLTPRLGPWVVQTHQSLTFAASYLSLSLLHKSSIVLKSTLPGTTSAQPDGRNPYSLPATDHDSSPPEVHLFGFAARLLTIGL